MRPLLPEPGDPGLHITGDDKNTIIDDDNPHGSRRRRGHCLHFNRHVLVDEGPVGGALNKLSRLEGAATDDFERAIAAACSIFDTPKPSRIVLTSVRKNIRVRDIVTMTLSLSLQKIAFLNRECNQSSWVGH